MNDNFRNWLIVSRNLNARSAGDVVCHLKRASNILNLNFKKNTEQLIFELSQTNEFSLFSVTVKSHLRRSIKLYAEFIKSEKSVKTS